MIYGNKHVVFEQVGLESSPYVWNSSSNTDSDGKYDDYEISYIRNIHLNQTIIAKLSSDLTNELVSTTIQTEKNGDSSALVSTTDKLFLPAEKELFTTRSYSKTNEFNALTTWQYWTSHTTNTDHIKYDSNSTAQTWWLRSPDGYGYACIVNSSGNANVYKANNAEYVSSCFAW